MDSNVSGRIATQVIQKIYQMGFESDLLPEIVKQLGFREKAELNHQLHAEGSPTLLAIVFRGEVGSGKIDAPGDCGPNWGNC